MSYRETYDMLDRASKRFKIRSDDNATNTDSQRTASVANNIQTEQNDSLCANMISEVIKVAAERVKGKQRTASVTTSSVKVVDEVKELQKFLSRYK